MINKAQLLQKVIQELQNEIQIQLEAARESKDAATNEESKAENEYDTRGLEASYLAGAQAKRVIEMENTLEFLQKLELTRFDSTTPIAETALVLIKQEDQKAVWYFILSKRGGVKVDLDGKTIRTLSLESPFGQNLVDKVQGDTFEFSFKGPSMKDVGKSYQIVEVL